MKCRHARPRPRAKRSGECRASTPEPAKIGRPGASGKTQTVPAPAFYPDDIDRSHPSSHKRAMSNPAENRCTAFDGHALLARGTLADVALAVKTAGEVGAAGPLLVFDDATGKVIDLD